MRTKQPWGRNLLFHPPCYWGDPQESIQWLSNAWLVHFQALSVNPSRIRYNPSSAINLVTLLPDLCSDVQHDCSTSSGAQPEHHAGLDWHTLGQRNECIYFMDGSSFIQNGIRYSGVSVMDLDSVIWAAALLLGTSAQKAELKVLPRLWNW